MSEVIAEPEKIPYTAEDTDAVVKKIIDNVLNHNPNANTDLIEMAYFVAKSAHKGQFRKSGAPYIEHPVQVAYIASEMSLDPAAIAACLLHDVVEDTSYTSADIAAIFGQDVRQLVDGVTKLKKIKYTTQEEQQVENLRKMFLAMAKDIRVVIIKLIDRLHNMRTLKYMPRKKQLIISRETLEVYAPLAHRLGMSKLKIELEDLGLKYLDPVAFEEIRQSINQKKSEREEYITDIIDTLRARLDEMGIEADIQGRAKHFYSIFRKMYEQNKTLDELYDLFAVRIIVNTIADCYSVLGMVHELYTPVPMRFKDYIAMPKPNGYQSLHTTVVGKNSTPFEIQIRTHEMHKVAEEGIAAHWKYKEGMSGENPMDNKLEWVRQLLETQIDIIDTDDFMNTLKIDLFSDEVFVFTPQGRVISLPLNATPIDFAFAVHTEVGYKMSGAKVNGKIVPNNYKLQNGEMVEILTQNSRGPSRDWLKVVKTSQAKNKINLWFKRECREENVEHGKELLDKELKRLGFTYAQLFRPEWVEPLLKRYSFKTMEDLYAGIGYGGLTAQKVVMRLREEWLAERRRLEREKQLTGEKITIPEPPRPKRDSGQLVVVKGIDNCLVRLAKCCNPVAGDDIIGFITNGRGVSVHRRDCPNMKSDMKNPAYEGRFIDVEWGTRATTYITNIQVEAPDRPGFLIEVTKALVDMNVTYKSVNAFVSKRGMAVVQIGLEISSTSDLQRISKKLKQLPGVEIVKRIAN